MLKRLLLLFLVLCCHYLRAQFQVSYYSPATGPIEDDRIYQTILSAGNWLMNENKTTPLSALAKQLDNESCQVSLKKPYSKALGNSALYNKSKEGVLVVATLFKCDHCPNDHVRAASGFTISEDGLGVTSYHIFRGNATDEKHDLAHVVMDHQGNVYPIKAVLAGHLGDDIAIFKFETDGRKLPVLPLGKDPQVGDDVTVIAHPHSMFYSFTQGSVSRLYKRQGGEKISITADFGQGSSGGPVFDNKGNIVGVVSATLSLYNSDNNLQMVSKETIPVSRIRALIK
ncbi:S1 family peptidase [Chryseosolibacter indicus]|uniref:Trypsin-like peptidase domain-containing protein n=1 Tax=Chryseosolibacter indicus TaxID=2782351 RepID=A0ABS5VYJ2_9BACT|nr:serine protease [Chryseosolibacter indicus]MBT1705989.1 trypsin-like peptidase domain-containing protein [Chryseosolibacter indicus]